MRDVKKSFGKKNKDTKTEKTKSTFAENPVFLAIVVFIAGVFINFLLELDFTKNLFNWCGYYFNYSIYWLNSVIQPTFKDHPFIHIPVLTNPITPQFMDIINPWMWTRGFLISSFVVGQNVTILQIKMIPQKNVILAAILAGIIQMGLYAMPYGSAITFPIFMVLLQKFYIDLLVLISVCIAGLLFGVEYAVYLYRNEKLQVHPKGDGPNIQVKYTDKLDW